MKNKTFLRVLCLVLVAVLLIPLLVGGASASPQGTALDAFKKIDVITDLTSSTVNGKKFSAADYPVNSAGEMQLLSLVEFGYSETGDQRDFGLFLYIYNPAQVKIDKASGQNKVQICRLFETDGSYKDFEKFQLEILSSYDDGRFLKCYVKNYYPFFNLTGRRYAVSGFELKSFAATNATEYTVGGDYTFTGYAKGFGKDPSAASTLQCEYKGMDTIRLNLKHTYYRTDAHESDNPYMHDQITSVWFTIPSEFVSEYQKLYAIRSSWIQVDTRPVLVTSNYEFYEQAYAKRGYSIFRGPNGERVDSSIPYMLWGREGDIPYSMSYTWSYNCPSEKWNIYFSGQESQLPFVFYSSEIKKADDIFDFFFPSVAYGPVSGSELQEYFNTYPMQSVEHIGGRPIPRDLYKAAGLVKSYVTLKSSVDLTESGTPKNVFDAFLKYCFDLNLPELTREVNAFEFVELDAFDDYSSNMSYETLEEIADSLVINVKDVGLLYDDVHRASLTGDKVVLFRFAKTDYEVFPITRCLGLGDEYRDSYIANMSLFLDFDIIDLTFENEGSYTVIPVVANPIDIFTDVQPPSDFGGSDNGWFQRLFALVLLVLLIVFIISFFPVVGNILLAIIAFPFNVIGSLIDYFKKRRR